MKINNPKSIFFYISIIFFSLIVVGLVGAIIKLINIPAILITIIIIGSLSYQRRIGSWQKIINSIFKIKSKKELLNLSLTSKKNAAGQSLKSIDQLITLINDKVKTKALKDEKSTLALPDLILIDGGKGQYSVARETLNDLGLHALPIIAIAKGKNRNAGNETFFHDGKIFKFVRNDPTLFFLQRLRDEAHRFAISTHRAKRRKNLTKSLLDQISGIGKGRKRALLNHFGSARSVESASFEDLKAVDGIEEKVAKKIHDFFHED